MNKTQHKFDEATFDKQLSTFEAAMKEDLAHRVSEASQKWDFDFASAKPTLQKRLTW